MGPCNLNHPACNAHASYYIVVCGLLACTIFFLHYLINGTIFGKVRHHHKDQGLDPLIRSVSRVTTVLANVSSVFQLLFFLVVCSDMISKGFGLVAFFASVKASSVCIHLSCPVCIQPVVHGILSHLFCGHKGCSLLEVSITSFLPLQFFVSVGLSEYNFLTNIKMWEKLKCRIFSKLFPFSLS
jgi:hypothetical protein